MKSVLDPCEDDNEGIPDDMSNGDDSMQQNEYYDTDSEVNGMVLDMAESDWHVFETIV